MTMRPPQKEELADKFDKKLLQIINEIEELHRQHNALVNQTQEDRAKLLIQIEQLQKNLQATSDVLAKQAKNSNIFEQQLNGVRTDISAAIAVVAVVFSLLFIVSMVVR